MPILRRAALAALLPVLLVTGAGAKKEKTSDLLLPDGFPPITQEERDLKEVPYAKGAPAVVLLNASQFSVDWDTAGSVRQLLHHYRRVKILSEAGKERYGDFRFNFHGRHWRVHKVEARTILPDGTVVDGKEGENIFRDKSKSGDVKVVRVAWPRIEVGAILDFHLSYAVDGITSGRWTLQERIPVLESRYGLIIPPGLLFRTAGVRLSSEQAQPVSFKHALGRQMDSPAYTDTPHAYRWTQETGLHMTSTAYIWRFKDLEPILQEAHQPPLDDISKALLLIFESVKTEHFFLPIAADWKSYSQRGKEDLDAWTKKGSGEATSLARKLCEGKATLREKAEAVRQGLRNRLRVDEVTRFRFWEGPDDVLAKGYGTSADLAALAVVMLRAVGVQADVVEVRRRSEGILPKDVPIPSLLDESIVRLPSEDEPAYFTLAEDLPVGTLPWDCRGVLGIPHDGVAETPVLIPDFKSSENKSVRVVNASVDPVTGTLTAESQETYEGVSGSKWRQELRPLDEAGRKETVREALRRWMPGAGLTSLEFENLGNDSKSLVLRAKWQVEGYATVAGKRLVVNLNLLGRVNPAEWAPTERRFDVDLGEAGEETDVVVLKLPEFFKEITLPQRAVMNAPPVGRYEISYERQPRAIVVRRNMTLDVYRFPANSYTGLKKWLGDVAAADDRPVVIALP